VEDTVELLYYPYCTVEQTESFNFTVTIYKSIKLHFSGLKISEAISVEGNSTLLTSTEIKVFNSMLREIVSEVTKLHLDKVAL